MSDCVPNVRRPVLWATHDVLTVWRQTGFYHQIFALRTEEPLADARTTEWLVFNQADAVVTRENENFLLMFRMWNDLIDFVSLKFFLSDFIVIIFLNSSMSDLNIHHTHMSFRVSHKQSSLLIKSQAIWVRIVKYWLLRNTSLTRC